MFYTFFTALTKAPAYLLVVSLLTETEACLVLKSNPTLTELLIVRESACWSLSKNSWVASAKPSLREVQTLNAWVCRLISFRLLRGVISSSLFITVISSICFLQPPYCVRTCLRAVFRTCAVWEGWVGGFALPEPNTHAEAHWDHVRLEDEFSEGLHIPGLDWYFPDEGPHLGSPDAGAHLGLKIHWNKLMTFKMTLKMCAAQVLISSINCW